MSNQLTTQQPTQNLPAHLVKDAGYKPEGLEILRQYVRPPRLKIVQPQSDAELKSRHVEGSVIVQPGEIRVAEMPFDEATKRYLTSGNPFTFVPLFFYPEYYCFNPIQLKQLPTIRERSLDPKGDVAAQAQDANAREMICPEDAKYMIRFVESLTFIVHVTSVPEIWGVPVAMMFMRGEHKTGTKLSGDIMLRKTDIYGNVFQASTAHRIKDKFNWYGYNITPPMQGSQWVEAADEYEYYKGIHADLREAHAANLLQVEIDDNDAPIDSVVVDANSPNAQY